MNNKQEPKGSCIKRVLSEMSEGERDDDGDDRTLARSEGLLALVVDRDRGARGGQDDSAVGGDAWPPAG